MKIKLIFLWTTFLISYISAQCFSHPNNIFASLEKVECKWNSNSIEPRYTTSYATDEMFQIQLNCNINNNVVCNNVLKEFNKAANLITSTFIFSTPIRVNVSYYDFCTVYPANICRDIGGAAYPTQFYLLQDDDGMSRLYPQSLVKQFQFPKAPSFNEFDINAEFNSKSGYWFEENLTTIGPYQGDIYWTIVHELMHGLGFYNGWMEYQKNRNTIGLIPMPVSVNPNDGSVSKNDLFSIDSSFVEFMMDKYTILRSNGTQISKFTQQLNAYFNEHKTNAFNDSFVNSSQFKFAQELLILSTTPKSLGLLPRNSNDFVSDSFILETSLRPFLQGSSLNHVDYNTYINSSDFLMTYDIVNGVTTDQMILYNGNYSGGPIGPKLKLMMETFGYTTTDNPNPYRPQPFKPSATTTTTTTTTTVKNSGLKLSVISNFNIIICILSIFVLILLLI